MAGAGNVRTITRDFEHWIRTVDPTREMEMRKTLEYEFGSGVHRRLFYGDPNKRGAYGDRVIGPEPEPEVDEILLEDGFKLLLEDGNNLLIGESTVEPDLNEFLLENGSKLVLENGENLLLEIQ